MENTMKKNNIEGTVIVNITTNDKFKTSSEEIRSELEKYLTTKFKGRKFTLQVILTYVSPTNIKQMEIN